MILTHKTECYPTKDQKQFFERCFGMRRFFFNKAVMTLKYRYGDLKENIRSIKSKEVMSMRKDVILKDYRELKLTVPDQILYTSMEDVIFALDSLRKKGRNIPLRKKKDSNTFRICKSGAHTTFWYENKSKYIGLPQFTKYNLPLLKMAESIRWENPNIRTVTIKKKANRYFISITCEVADLPQSENLNRHLGMDWGISTYFTAYDGKDMYEINLCEITLKRLDRRIAKNQKSLARKVRFSGNWFKVKTKLEQSYLDFNNYRDTFIKETVFVLSELFDSVTLEDLCMNFVTRNKKLAHKAKQKPFYMFKVALINKFKNLGKKVYLVPKTYPSTQTCNSCGYVKTGSEKMKLGEKVYKCPSCNKTHDRDQNAAMNLYSFKNLVEASIEE